MAVVRITDQLKQDVLRSVDAHFKGAQEKAQLLRPEIGEAVYTAVLGPHAADMARVPLMFFTQREDIQITIKRRSRDVCENWSIESKPFPQDIPKRNGVKYEISHYSGVQITLARIDEFAHIHEEVDAWQDAIKGVEEDRKLAHADVSKILDSFTTLSPALKAWPALWDLLPDDTREKHKEIVERTKPKPVTVNTGTKSLEHLTSRLVKARVTKKAEE